MTRLISLLLSIILFTGIASGKDRILDSLFQAGTTNLYNGNYDQAFNDFFERKVESEKQKDSLSLTQSLTYLGEVCRATQQFDLGLDYLNQALALSKEIRDSFSIAKALNRIAAIKYEQGDLDAATSLAQQSLKIFQDIHDANMSANNLNILGAISTSKKDYVRAIGYYDQARKTMVTLPDQSDLPNILNNIANNYYRLGQFQNGLPYVRESFELASKNKTRAYLLEACRMMARGDSGIGNFKEALHYSQLAASINEDLIIGFKKAEKATIELKNQNELTTKENTLLKQINDENVRLIKAQQTLFWIIVSGLILLSGFLLLLSILYRQRKKSLKILRDQNALVENQKQELHELNHLKNNLLAVISHDFRAPLITLHAMIEFLDMGADSKQEVKGITERMKRQIFETIETLDNMMVWLRKQMHGSQINKGLIELQNFVADLVKPFSTELPAKHIIIQNNIGGGLTVFTDPEMLKIILRNLISNAIKFSLPANPVFIEANKTDGHVCISIRDVGTGISPEVKEKLFTSENISTRGTQNEKGIGMGLILAHDLLTQLDGTIEVQSEVNKGSTFTVTLPG